MIPADVRNRTSSDLYEENRQWCHRRGTVAAAITKYAHKRDRHRRAERLCHLSETSKPAPIRSPPFLHVPQYDEALPATH